MSYEPTNWKAGDTVTSAKLNKIEQGIAGGVNILLVGVTINDNGDMILDKTWQEIFDADIAFVVNAGENVKGVELVYGVNLNLSGDTYGVMAGGMTYTAQSADDYPNSAGGK